MKNKNLISISGKIGSGKDTVGAIIQMLMGKLHHKTNMWDKKDLITRSDSSIMRFKENHSDYQIRKFADKLKDIVCILLGCSREQLEDREFKEKELGEEWNKYALYREGTRKPLRVYATLEEAEKDLQIFKGGRIEKIVMTPRKLLQLLGTEACRDIIHPNIWCNALLKGYKLCDKWIITDTRYPNEIDAISKLGGIKIKVVNPRVEEGSTHLSEIALDNYKDWDYVIVNKGTLDDLENEVRDILIDMGHEI